ncbi:Uncharacterized protein OBRU01_04591 [Operophtera brumata]|uniref:Uncharacterized protein n=1 Tax=Operophtera brumata TaxID=104452 RepID=A0A0L7LNX6_OPEBR|nr:Uncharacterized protein OBRU01_04591 [Operophtera brumata]
MEMKKTEKPGSLSPNKPALKRDSGDEGKSSRSSSKSEKELKLPPEKSPSDDGSKTCTNDFNNYIDIIWSHLRQNLRQDSKTASVTSPKVSRKYFTNWKQACDKTKDKTKELLKRWRTLPESEIGDEGMETPGHTTWVNRCSEDLECLDLEDEQPLATLSLVQTDKMTLFFTQLLDHDRDDASGINMAGRTTLDGWLARWALHLSELKRFSDLPLYLQYLCKILFHVVDRTSKCPCIIASEVSGIIMAGRTTLDGWLARWALHLSELKRFSDLPLYLQYLCKILFHVVDRTSKCPCIIASEASGIIMAGRTTLDGWLNPNGPGQWVLVPPKDPLPQPPFPVDYSALNTEPAKLEPYAPDKKTNRHSVIV